MANKKPMHSDQSNAISRWNNEGGAPGAGDPARQHFRRIERLRKGAVESTHTEDCGPNSATPGKGRLAAQGGVLRKKGR
jgi:hypothetical protein